MSTNPQQLLMMQQQAQDPSFPVQRGEQIPPAYFNAEGPSIIDKLQALAGVVGLGGGTAANIIAAKKRGPETGNAAISLGNSQLNEASKNIENKLNVQRIAKFLPDLKSKDDAVLAQQYLKAGDWKSALGVVNSSYEKQKDFQNKLTLQNKGFDYQMQKYDDQNFDIPMSKLMQLSEIQAKKLNGEPVSKAEEFMARTNEAYLNKNKFVISPLSNPSPAIQKALTDKVERPISNAESTKEYANNIIDSLLALPGGPGPASGRINRLLSYFEANPELRGADLLKRIMQAKTTTGIMGESSRHANQIEQDLKKVLFNENLKKEDLMAIKKSINFAADDSIRNAKAAFMSINGATEDDFKTFYNKVARHPLEETSAPPKDHIDAIDAELARRKNK